MQITYALLPLFAGLVLAAPEPYQTLSPADEELINSIGSMLESITTYSGYAAFESGAASMQSEWLSTQTLISLDPMATTEPDEATIVEYEAALYSIAAKFAATQTFITGAPKSTIVSLVDEFVSIMFGDSESGPSASAKTTGTSSAKETPSKTGGAVDASTSPSGSGAGRVIAGAMAGVVAAIAAVAVL